MAAEYRDVCVEEAKEAARKAVNLEYLQRAKDLAAQIEEKQLEDRLRSKITADIKKNFDDEFESRFAAAFKQRMTDLLKQTFKAESSATAPTGAKPADTPKTSASSIN